MLINDKILDLIRQTLHPAFSQLPPIFWKTHFHLPKPLLQITLFDMDIDIVKIGKT